MRLVPRPSDSRASGLFTLGSPEFVKSWQAELGGSLEITQKGSSELTYVKAFANLKVLQKCMQLLLSIQSYPKCLHFTDEYTEGNDSLEDTKLTSTRIGIQLLLTPDYTQIESNCPILQRKQLRSRDMYVKKLVSSRSRFKPIS